MLEKHSARSTAPNTEKDQNALNLSDHSFGHKTSLFDHLRSKVYTGVALAATTLPVSASTLKAEAADPRAPLPATAPVDPARLSTAKQQAYAAGREEGRRLGRMEGALDTALPMLKDELQRLGRTLGEMTDVEVRDEWVRFKETAEVKLNEIEKARQEQSDDERELQTQLTTVAQLIENLRPWKLLAKQSTRGETGTTSGGSAGGQFDIRYGNVVERDLWEAFGGQVKDMLKGAFNGLNSPGAEPGVRFPKPSPEQTKQMHNLRDAMRSGLKKDVENIKAKRELERKQEQDRLKAQNKG
ncbi:MAG: hypothetical protein GX589_05955 [Deltaproteobacteria bacterium]|nr:hypothetical protein [Deltaproteobacteria bacterium]